MKGFIEVTHKVKKEKMLLNVNHILNIVGSTIYIAIMPHTASYAKNVFEESYEEIKAKIAEAVG